MVLVLVVVLAGTNLLTLAALAWVALRPPRHPAPDPALAASLASMRPGASTSSARRIITIEILNPIELAGTRGRLAGIAGSFAPGITQRVVYEQVIRTLRHQLQQERVVADVRLHQVRPAAPEERARPDHPGVAEVVEAAEAEPGSGPVGEPHGGS